MFVEAIFNSEMQRVCFSQNVAASLDATRQIASELYTFAANVVTDDSNFYFSGAGLAVAGGIFMGVVLPSIISDVRHADRKDIASMGRVFWHSFISTPITMAVRVASFAQIALMALECLASVTKESSDGLTCYDWKEGLIDFDSVLSVFLTNIPATIGLLLLAITPLSEYVGDACAKIAMKLVRYDLSISDIAKLRFLS